MADRELKKLSRLELIDLIYQLRSENVELEQRLNECDAKLSERTITVENAGSIAAAALALNDVFETAQRAADQYLHSVKMACTGQETQIQKTKQQCAQMLSEAAEEAEKIRSDAEKERLERLAAADRECKKKYDQLVTRANQYIREHPEARALFIKQQKQE